MLAVAAVGVEPLLAFALRALAGGADVHHRQVGLLGEGEGAGVEGVGELLVVLGDDAGAAAVGAVERDHLDAESVGRELHRAVQLRREAAGDATGPVGNLDLLAHASSFGSSGSGAMSAADTSSAPGLCRARVDHG